MSHESQLLLYWPDGLQPYRAPGSDAATAANVPCQYILGWNPRGTVMCVADIVTADSVEVAEAEARRLRRAHDDILPGLRLLGRHHDPASGGSPPSRNDDGSKSRRNGDIWAELAAGPTLLELYVCGFRVPAQLLTVHYSCRQQYSVKTSHLSAISRLGYLGVKKALSGAKATALCPGTISRSEGPFLPAFRANLNVLRRTDPSSPGLHFADNNSLTEHALASTRGGGSATSLSSLDNTHTTIASALSPEKVAAANYTQTFRSEDFRSESPLHDSVVGPGPEGRTNHPEWREEDIVSTVPPRLSFPTWASTTELSYVLKCINQGREIRRVARNPRYVPYSETQAIIRDGPLKAALRRCVGGLRHVILALLAVVTIVARFSYVFSTLEFKLRELACCLAVSSHVATACGLHAFVPHSFVDEDVTELGKTRSSQAPNPTRNTIRRQRERRQCLAHYIARSAADVVLGAIFSLVLARYSGVVAGALGRLAWWGIFELHLGYLDWFHGWPAGFKLNDELNEVVGMLCRGVFSLWRQMTEGANVDWMGMALNTWIVISPLGLSFAVSFVADVCNVVTLHIRNMLHIMSWPYRVVLAIISSLLLQFRGKRRNTLRNRVDEWLFSADEMILGILVGTVTLFVAPTVTMYYLYFAAARTIIWVLQESLRGIAMLSCFLPVYPLLLWCSSRYRLPNGISFARLRVRPAAPQAAFSTPSSPATASPGAFGHSGASNDEAAVVEVDLQNRPMEFAEVTAEFAVLMRYVLESSLNPGRIVRFVLQAREKPIMDLRGSVFAHLIPDPANPTIPKSR
jgi:hypothetical protein